MLVGLVICPVAHPQEKKAEALIRIDKMITALGGKKITQFKGFAFQTPTVRYTAHPPTYYQRISTRDLYVLNDKGAWHRSEEFKSLEDAVLFLLGRPPAVKTVIAQIDPAGMRLESLALSAAMLPHTLKQLKTLEFMGEEGDLSRIKVTDKVELYINKKTDLPAAVKVVGFGTKYEIKFLKYELKGGLNICTSWEKSPVEDATQIEALTNFSYHVQTQPKFFAKP